MAENRIATEQEMAEDAIATATERTKFTRVVVTVGDEDYTLEFNRRTVKQMEQRGFNVAGLDEMPTTTIEQLVRGAFEMHHPSMPAAQRMAVWDALGGKQGDDGLLNALVQLYMAPVNSLIADPTTPTGTWKLA